MSRDYIQHPKYGIYEGKCDDSDTDRGINPHDGCRIRTGYVCPKCNKNVLAYRTPRNCNDHDEEIA